MANQPKTTKRTATKKPATKKPAKAQKPKAEAAEQQIRIVTDKTSKDEATRNGDPWVSILSMEIDPDNLSAGAVELDWNDKFILQLQRHGYTGKTDSDMVDQWFTNLCRHVVLETYQQSMADPENRSDSRFVQDQKLDNGKREYR